MPELFKKSSLFAAYSANHFQRFPYSGDDCPVVFIRCISEKKVEYRNLVLHPGLVEGFSHRVLVLV